ncbi:hypothetical protein B0H17DRAFT_113301 [Mycena rosella]|uniref:Uncharacterized protein n=1 Tax=Mycena rosella TaxID=1033263 RepID=A0AAD7D472_MYCRO|nr:hypothetical protein B0H17DRAFT_113301 [Mycena rosella]
MKNPLLFPLLSAAFTASQSHPSTENESGHTDSCEIRAWVRAEDLSPDHISHGELRIKVPDTQCAQQIASVALRLQFDEFGEFKFLKKGAEIPDVRHTSNQTMPGDPALWTIGAEERRVWTTQATLVDRNLAGFPQPNITPSLSLSRK